MSAFQLTVSLVKVSRKKVLVVSTIFGIKQTVWKIGQKLQAYFTAKGGATISCGVETKFSHTY